MEQVVERCATKNDVFAAGWTKFSFWRNVFLYYWFFAWLGHLVEVAWAVIGGSLGLVEPFLDRLPIMAVAAPYGLGAVALRFLIYPLVRSKRLGIALTYVSSVIITTAVELICGLLIVAIAQHNYFWNYSNLPLNLFGQVWIGNSLLFGLVSLFAIRFAFPWFDDILKRVRGRWLDAAFVALLTGYIIAQGKWFM